MRYDDRLETVMRLSGAEPGARVSIWAQMVDLLAQHGDRLSPARRDELVARITRWRDTIPEDRRRQSAQSLAGRKLPVALVALYATDKAAVAAPLVARAVLDEAEWLAIIPAMAPPARALLRGRRDLPERAQVMLSSYGPSDFILASDADELSSGTLPQLLSETEGSKSTTPIQISELVARIEAFRHARVPYGQPSDAPLPIPAFAQEFRFETGADGVLSWVEGVPRGAIIGLSLAEMAQARSAGVDGHAAGAFRQRNIFRDARMLVAGEGLASGAWLISGDPVFDPETGRFCGYRGVARRPAPEEFARKELVSVFGPDVSADSVRQLVHELRTPLNAIRGFAEMIEGQLLGPVASGYRDRAVVVVEEAGRLLATIDDLDCAARLETGSYHHGDGQGAVDCGQILHAAVSDLRQMISRRRVQLVFDDTPSGITSPVDRLTLDRIYTRLLIAVISMAQEGEEVRVSLGTGSQGVAVFHLSLPRGLRGRSEAELLDPDYSPDGNSPDAPALGLGFSLRLAANMAQSVHGALSIGLDSLSLILPATRDSASDTQGIG